MPTCYYKLKDVAMNTKQLVSHQKNLAQQIDGFVECRNLMIQTAVNRANNYLNIINSGGDNIADNFIAQQRKIVKAQPIPMDKKIEGVDYLPAWRHAFKGVPMPKSQIIKTVESEKQRNMGHILAGLLPVPVSEAVVMTVINAEPAPLGIIDAPTIKNYLAGRLRVFLSFAHYQTVLSKISRSLTSTKEINFAEHSVRDLDEIEYIVGHLYVFDFLYANKNSLCGLEVVEQAGGFISDVMTIHTGVRLDKLTGIDLGSRLREALSTALKTHTTTNQIPQKNRHAS